MEVLCLSCCWRWNRAHEASSRSHKIGAEVCGLKLKPGFTWQQRGKQEGGSEELKREARDPEGRMQGRGNFWVHFLREWKKASGKTGRKRGDIFMVKNRCTLFDATHSSNRQNFLIQSIVGRCILHKS